MKKRGVILFLLIGFIYSGIYAQKIVWKHKAEIPKPMRGTAVSCNNEIYFMEANHEISGVYEYNVIDDTWKKITNMNTQGWNVNLAEIDGIIYAIGGDPFRDRIESYEPLRNIWNVLTPMTTARQHSNCCVVNKKIYVMGGITSWTNKTDKNEVYDPKTDSWQTLSPLPDPFENPIIASVDNNIYALCGNILWMYDTSSDKWETKESCPAWISIMFGSAVINDKIIFPGGQNKEEKAVSSVYIYNTTSNTWSRSTDLPKPIQIGGITTLNGKIYMIGGCDTNFNKYNTVYEGTLDESTETDQLTNKDDLLIFPNPAINYIQVHGSDHNYKFENFQILTIDGKIIKEDRLESARINISDLNKGVFLLKLKTSERIISKKIVIN